MVVVRRNNTIEAWQYTPESAPNPPNWVLVYVADYGSLDLGEWLVRDGAGRYARYSNDTFRKVYYILDKPDDTPPVEERVADALEGIRKALEVIAGGRV